MDFGWITYTPAHKSETDVGWLLCKPTTLATGPTSETLRFVIDCWPAESVRPSQMRCFVGLFASSRESEAFQVGQARWWTCVKWWLVVGLIQFSTFYDQRLVRRDVQDDFEVDLIRDGSSKCVVLPGKMLGT